MKRHRDRIEASRQPLEVRDAWMGIVTSNYEIGEKLKLALDPRSSEETGFKDKFFNEQRNDDLLKYVYLFRKVSTHDIESVFHIGILHMLVPGEVMTEWQTLSDPKPDQESFVRNHPLTAKTPMAVWLRRFKHWDYGKDKGWVYPPGRHLGRGTVSDFHGVTPSNICSYLIPYYEAVFHNLASFPPSDPPTRELISQNRKGKKKVV